MSLGSNYSRDRFDGAKFGMNGIFVPKFFIIGYFQCSWFLSNFSFLRIRNECALSGRRTRIWNYVNFSKSLKTVNVELISKVPAVRFCSSPLAILRILVPCDRKNWIKVFIRPNSNWNIRSMIVDLEISLGNKITTLGITKLSWKHKSSLKRHSNLKPSKLSWKLLWTW